jgi:hypothetical protein
VRWTGTALLAAAIGLYIGLAWATANPAGLGKWLRSFAQSPGPAAIAAVFAASVAYAGIRSNRRTAAAALTQQKSAADADAWWATFEWASERSIPARPEDKPLPTAVTARTLERLAEVATSAVQEAACSGMLDVLAERYQQDQRKRGDASTASGDASTGTASIDAETESTMEAFQSYAESNRGTAAESRAVEALVYRNSVEKALLSLTTSRSDIRVFRTPPGDGRADAIAEVAGKRVAVNFARLQQISLIGQWIATQAQAEERTNPRLLVTPVPSPLSLEDEREHRLVVTQWRDPQDDKQLLAALTRASEL